MRRPSLPYGQNATLGLAVALGLALVPAHVGAVGAQGETPGETRVVASADTCERAFAAAEAILVVFEGASSGASVADLREALLDLTISSCPRPEAWLAAAAAHPGVLDGADPESILPARCANAGAVMAALPACAPRVEPRLVDLPRVKPRVRGADTTRYYPIEGRSPDELFTQMQVNGSRSCPTHALACVNIQPRIRPLVSSASGTCRVIGIRASFSAEANLPRWAAPDRVYPELADWWRLVAARIGRHEQEHIRIANRYLSRLKREIIGNTCSSLQAYVTRWSKGLTAAQDAFDAKELQRPWPEYDGPTP